MKLRLTLLASTILLCPAARSAEPKRTGEFQRAVVKDVPAFFSPTPIGSPKSKDSIVVFFQGEFIQPGMHEIRLDSTVATLFRPKQGGPGPLICGIDSMSVLRKEGEETVVYTARGSGLARQLFPLVQGDRIFYRATGF